MRYIDLSIVKTSKNWKSNSSNALKELCKKTPSERSDYIATKQKTTWKDKRLLRALLHLVNNKMSKCWYSESKITDDVDIDHFRPKGKNENLSFDIQYSSHLSKVILDKVDFDVNKGWWFLAFDVSNFRVCSCNRNRLRYDIHSASKADRAKGKADYFPLKKGSPVAIDEQGIQDEDYCLLDPCNPNDPEHLSCDNNGNFYTLNNDLWIQCRVEISVAVYHLDETQLVEARRAKWLGCEKYIVERIIDILKSGGDINDIQNISDDFFDNWADRKTEFSSVAIDCIRHYKRQYGFLDLYFPDIKLVK